MHVLCAWASLQPQVGMHRHAQVYAHMHQRTCIGAGACDALMLAGMRGRSAICRTWQRGAAEQKADEHHQLCQRCQRRHGTPTDTPHSCTAGDAHDIEQINRQLSSFSLAEACSSQELCWRARKSAVRVLARKAVAVHTEIPDNIHITSEVDAMSLNAGLSTERLTGRSRSRLQCTDRTDEPVKWASWHEQLQQHCMSSVRTAISRKKCSAGLLSTQVRQRRHSCRFRDGIPLWTRSIRKATMGQSCQSDAYVCSGRLFVIN